MDGHQTAQYRRRLPGSTQGNRNPQEVLNKPVFVTPTGDWLDVLVTLVEAWEDRHYPLEFPDPVEAIKYTMEQKGQTVKDLEPMIGHSNRVYEMLNHKRPLTLKMIWRLHKGLGIPAECLIGQGEESSTALAA